MLAPLPGAVVSVAVMGSPASVVGRDLVGGEVLEGLLLLGRGGGVEAHVLRRAVLRGELLVVLRRDPCP